MRISLTSASWHFQGTLVCRHSQLSGHWTITRWLDKARPVSFLCPCMVLLLGRAISFKYCPDQIIWRCMPEEKQKSVLSFCHELACGGHFGPRKTAEKVLQSGFYWPILFKDSFHFCKSCVNCQKIEKILRRDMMPLNPILEVEIFEVWGIDFMRPFPNSFGNQFILIVVDY